MACAGVTGGPARSYMAVLNHTLSAGTKLGVMDHFWWCQGDDFASMRAKNLRVEVQYLVDGEQTPSISFEPAFACGQGWPVAELGGKWVDTQALVGNRGVYAAGTKMGKGGVAQTSGWWHDHKVPFQSNILIRVAVISTINATATSHPFTANSTGTAKGGVPPGCLRGLNAIVRGHETNNSLTLSSGEPLPIDAKLKLHRIDSKVFQPQDFVELVSLPAGVAGLMYMMTLALETRPWTTCDDPGCTKHHTTNNYVEGCWHLLRDTQEQLPGLITGTGLEDGLDSAFGFSIISADPDSPTGLNRQCNGNFSICHTEGVFFQNPKSGVLAFHSDYTGANAGSDGPVERLSVYRFFDHEIFAFDDGGTFGWHNGAFSPGSGDPTADYGGKCYATKKPAHGGFTSPTKVSSYAWVYTWARQ